MFLRATGAPPWWWIEPSPEPLGGFGGAGRLRS